MENPLKKISEFNRIILTTAILIFVLLVSTILLLNQLNDDSSLNHEPSIKIIEKHIAGTEKTINNYERLIGDEKKIIRQITSEIDKLRLELSEKKELKDTVQIVQIQDTLIHSLTEENVHLYSVINLKDSIIHAQRYIINSKDTIIVYQNEIIDKNSKDKRKLKWRNKVLAGVAILEAGVIIIQSTKK